MNYYINDYELVIFLEDGVHPLSSNKITINKSLQIIVTTSKGKECVCKKLAGASASF